MLWYARGFRMLLYAVLCFHTFSNASKRFQTLLYAFIRFQTLSYAFIRFHTLSYAFIRFHTLFYALERFSMFLNAFICFYTLLHALIGQTVRTRRSEADSLSNRLLPAEAGKKRIWLLSTFPEQTTNAVSSIYLVRFRCSIFY